MKYFSTDNNQIKFINSETFSKLVKLERITLSFNLCINEDFEDHTRISAMPELIKNSCGYCEKIVDITNCEMLKEIQQIHLKNAEKIENWFNERENQNQIHENLIKENRILHLENDELKNKLKELEGRSQKNNENLRQSENSSSTINDSKFETFQNELKVQFKNQEKLFRDLISRDKETFQLNMEAKTSEISNKTATIAKLEAELKAAKDQMVLTEDFQRKLEDQRNEMFKAKIEELTSEVEKLKVQIEFCSTKSLC